MPLTVLQELQEDVQTLLESYVHDLDGLDPKEVEEAVMSVVHNFTSN